MNHTELRCGNLIGLNLSEFPQNFFKVLEVAETNMKVTSDWIRTEKRPESDFFDCDLMEGIRLTPEWLEIFGLHKDWSPDFNKTIGISIFQNGKAYGFSSKPIKIEYVHQLQNLYFALTWEELKLK